jgi:acyl-CoA thioesterase-1
MRSYGKAIGLVSAALLSAPALLGQLAPSSTSATAANTTTAPSALPALQVLTIGDSIMNGHGVAAGEAWPYLVAANDGWSLDNDACDGVGVIALGDPAECNSTYTGVIADASTMTPDIVIFEGSSNDFGQDDAQLLAGTITDLRALRTEFPQAEIVGLSTLWGAGGAPGQLVAVNAQVKQAVEDVGGTYLDIGQPMATHPEMMQADNVHPNAAGQALIATTIEAAIKPVVADAVKHQREAAAQAARINQLLAIGRIE